MTPLNIIQQIKERLMAPGGELEQASNRWIQTVCRSHPAASIEVVDMGYDVSSFGRRTNEPIDAASFTTIQDFLDSPTGESIPTFNSGSGMRAESWEDRFIEFVRDYIWEWLSNNQFDPYIKDENGFVDDGFVDALCDSDADEYTFVYTMAEKRFPRLVAVTC